MKITETFGQKFNDRAAAMTTKLEAAFLALQINARKQKAKEIFEIFFTKEVLELLAANDFLGARKLIISQASGEKVDIPSLGQVVEVDHSHKRAMSLYDQERNVPGSQVEIIIFDEILPLLNGREHLYSLLELDEEKHELKLRFDVDTLLGLDKKGSNKKYAFDNGGYRKALQFLEAITSESKKAAKYFQELGYQIDNTFLVDCMESSPGTVYQRLIQKEIYRELSLHFHSIGGDINSDRDAVADAVAVKYRPIYALLRLLETGKNELPKMGLYLTTFFLKGKDNALTLADGAKELLEMLFTEWTHSFEENEILPKIGEYRKLRKKIEADGLTLKEFELITRDVISVNDIRRIFRKK